MFWSSAADPIPAPPADGRAHQAVLPFVDCREEPFTALFGIELQRNETLHRVLDRYAFVHLSELAQTAGCTRYHVVEARLARLTDFELSTLADRIDQAPAAGADILAVIGVVFVVLLILEAVGVIDVFKKFP